MGNEASSQLSLLAECSVDETPIVTSGDWTLHHAQRRDGQAGDPSQLSVYIAREQEGDGHNKRGSGQPSQLDLLEKVSGTMRSVSMLVPSIFPRRRWMMPIMFGIYNTGLDTAFGI